MPHNKNAQQEQRSVKEGTNKKGQRGSAKVPSQPGATKMNTKIVSHPPELLCAVELTERPEICSIVQTMMITRQNILDNEKNWSTASCNEMTHVLADKVLSPLMSENVFLPLEIQDLFQSLLDYQLGRMKCENESLDEMVLVHLTKMRFIIIQIIDEIYKDLFRMEEEEILDDESGEEDESDVNTNKELYKKLRM
jgi:hypothetical protein